MLLSWPVFLSAFLLPRETFQLKFEEAVRTGKFQDISGYGDYQEDATFYTRTGLNFMLDPTFFKSSDFEPYANITVTISIDENESEQQLVGDLYNLELSLSVIKLSWARDFSNFRERNHSFVTVVVKRDEDDQRRHELRFAREDPEGQFLTTNVYLFKTWDSNPDPSL